MILNLTQHKATTEQLNAHVFEVSDRDRGHLKRLLTFEDIFEVVSHTEEGLSGVECRAHSLARIAAEYCIIEGKVVHSEVMIGGAPYLMSYLEWAGSF